MDKVATTESSCHFCKGKIYSQHFLRCSWCLHAGCLSCLANDNCVCGKCAKIKESNRQTSFTGCLSGLANDDCRCDNCIKTMVEDIKKSSVNCHFCNDEILVPYPLVCKTCKYIGCMKCLNDDCICSNCVKSVEKFPRSSVCYSCDVYKEVNNEGFCDECIHQTALYHSNDAQVKAAYTKSELEFIKNSSNRPESNSINNSNHGPTTNSSPIVNSGYTPNKSEVLRLRNSDDKLPFYRTPDYVNIRDREPVSSKPKLDRPVKPANIGIQIIKEVDLTLSPEIDVSRLVEELYPNLGKEGPCKDCGEKTNRRVIFQTAVPDPYFLCMSCARCSVCGEENRGRCWIWPADKQLVCGYCVCKISMECDNSWNESMDKAVHISVIIEMYREKTEKDEHDLACIVRELLFKRINSQQQTQLEQITL